SLAYFFVRPRPPPPGRFSLSLHDALPICAGRDLYGGRRQLRHVHRVHVGYPTGSRCGKRHPSAAGAGGWPADRELHVSSRGEVRDRKSTRLNSSHVKISYAVFCLKKKNTP